MEPAVCLLEFSSIAKGIEAGDAMIKRAPLQVIRAGTVHPGKYLVLVGGFTADVEEAIVGDGLRHLGGEDEIVRGEAPPSLDDAGVRCAVERRVDFRRVKDAGVGTEL